MERSRRGNLLGGAGVWPDGGECRRPVTVGVDKNDQCRRTSLMTTRSRSIRMRDHRDSDEHELRLRHRILKLRWIGSEADAKSLEVRLGKSDQVAAGPMPLEALDED
jgi:hypothetical protein